MSQDMPDEDALQLERWTNRLKRAASVVYGEGSELAQGCIASIDACLEAHKGSRKSLVYMEALLRTRLRVRYRALYDYIVQQPNNEDPQPG